jgi:hypothetical protein
VQIFIFDDSFGDFSGKVVCNGDIDVIGRDRESLDNEGLNQKTSNNFFCRKSFLKIAV